MTQIRDSGLAPPLPNSDEAERSILGAVLLDNAVLEIARTTITTADFFQAVNRKIYAAMLVLADRREPIDTITLFNYLSGDGELESAGGVAHLSQLADNMPRAANVGYYSNIVKQKAILRRCIHAASDMQERAFTAGDASVLLPQMESCLTDLRSGTATSGEPPNWRETFHSYRQFEESGDLSFSIGGFLQNGGATIIGGLSGHGKTLILCSVAKALLAGKGAKLWKHFPVQENAVRVVYLIPECSLGPFKQRLRLFGIYDALAPDDERLLVRTLSAGPTPSLSDPRILWAAKGAHVILDTAIRFADGDENSASEVSRGLATDIFSLLNAGARSVLAAHHAPKSFESNNRMTLEGVLRGSGDVGAMATTAWAIKQVEPEQNIIHVECVKSRDLLPCAPFEIIGRPFINDEGDFRMHQAPGEAGSLADAQPELNRGGAPQAARDARAAHIELLRRRMIEHFNDTSEQHSAYFASIGITLSPVTLRKYRSKIKIL